MWRHCYRAATVCVNASCEATGRAALGGGYCGVSYTADGMPQRIPLLVTTCDSDERGFRSDLADGLVQRYAYNGHPQLLVQFHCASDTHFPRSVPPRMALLINTAVGLGSCGDVHSARHLPAMRELKRSLADDMVLRVGGQLV